MSIDAEAREIAEQALALVNNALEPQTGSIGQSLTQIAAYQEAANSDATNAANAAIAAEAALALVTTQASYAQMAAVLAGAFPLGAAANVPVGLPQAGVGAITPGSGGTNGTWPLSWSGGTFTYNPVGTFTVTGGVVTAVNIQFPGLYLGSSATVPTPSFAASASLSGANVALTAKALYGSGQGYWALSADGTFYQHYTVNSTGAPVADSGMTSPTPVVVNGLTTSLLNTRRFFVVRKQVLTGQADSNLAALFATLIDGTQKTFATNPLQPITAFMTTRRFYLVRKQVLTGQADSNLAALFASLADGTQKTFATNSLQPASSLVTGGFSVALTTRKLYIFRQQVTSGGTDSQGMVEYARTLGGRIFPYAGNIKSAPFNITCVGDSLTQGIYAPPYPQLLAAVPSMVGRTVTNLGVTGQSSRAIAGRIGAVAFGFTLNGNQIVSGSNNVTAITGNALIEGATLVGPASGTIVLGGPGTGREGTYYVLPSQTWSGTFTVAGDSPTTYTASISGTTMVVTSVAGVPIQGMATAGSLLFNQFLSNSPDTITRSVTGYMGFVHGTLTRTAPYGAPSTSETYTFVPDAGTANLPIFFAPGTVFQPDYAHLNDTHIFWIGGNGPGDYPRILADIAACVALLPHKRFLIISIYIGQAQSKGSALWTEIFAGNQMLASLYPQNFVDLRSYLIYEGMTALGLTPTSTDLTNISNDVIPTSLLGNPSADPVHPSGATNGVIAAFLANIIVEKGF